MTSRSQETFIGRPVKLKEGNWSGGGAGIGGTTRTLLARAIAPAAAARHFDRPIFILAPPRSGATFLFECLSRFQETVHLRLESDLYWWFRFPYDHASGHCDYVPRASLTSADARFLYRRLYRHAVINCIRQRRIPPSLGLLLGLRRIRYLDKTVANCFHLEVLEHLFPEARYVHLVRDPRDNIASMIEGWPHVYRFGKPQLTPVVQALEPRTIEHWTYPAPPGWQAVVDRPLSEICAWSWQQHVEWVLRFFERRPGKPIRVVYEELVRNPVATIQGLGDALDLRWSDEVERYAEAAPSSRTTLSPPSPGKWRGRHQEAIERVFPLIEATATKLGYRLDRQ